MKIKYSKNPDTNLERMAQRIYFSLLFNTAAKLAQIACCDLWLELTCSLLSNCDPFIVLLLTS